MELDNNTCDCKLFSSPSRYRCPDSLPINEFQCDGSRFRVLEDEHGWRDAERQCQLKTGGHMAMFESEESRSVCLAQALSTCGANGVAPTHAYAGLSNLYEPNVFRWTYDNSRSLLPLPAGPWSSHACSVVSSGSSRVVLENCTRSRSVVCQRPIGESRQYGELLFHFCNIMHPQLLPI